MICIECTSRFWIVSWKNERKITIERAIYYKHLSGYEGYKKPILINDLINKVVEWRNEISV
jgi:hypothetical protein